MFTIEQFIDWRDSDITQEMYKAVSEVAGDTVGTILNRRESNPLDDQFLKGYLQGLSAVVGWKPTIMDTKTGNVVDALAGENDEA
jgi:hypothetical protein